MSLLRPQSMQCYISTTVMLKALSDWKVTTAAYWSLHKSHDGEQQKYDMVRLRRQQENGKVCIPHTVVADKLSGKAISSLSLK